MLCNITGQYPDQNPIVLFYKHICDYFLQDKLIKKKKIKSENLRGGGGGICFNEHCIVVNNCF